MASREKLQALIDAEREAAGILSQAEKKAAEVASGASAKADDLRAEFQQNIVKKRRGVEDTLKAESVQVRKESEKRVDAALAELEKSVAAGRAEAVEAVVEAIRG
jgi:cell division septum initiation protein DivIVA